MVVAMPATSQDKAALSPVVDDAPPREDLMSFDQEEVGMEGTQQIGSTRQKTVFHGTDGTLIGIHLVNTC